MNMNTNAHLAPASASAPFARPRRRLRKRWIAVVGVLVVALQFWALGRNAGRVRLVVYNDGPGPVADVGLVCLGEVAVLGELAVEESRQAWFRPPDRSAVVVLKWADETGPHEAGWSAEHGERLTVRVGPEGATAVTRERSLGRRFLDAIREP